VSLLRKSKHPRAVETRRALALCDTLLRHARLLAREGMRRGAAIDQAIAECRPLPPEEWVALTRAVWMSSGEEVGGG
jgi:hypothetical protein